MADDVNILRVGNPKSDGETEEPNGRDMSRRNFIGWLITSGLVAVAGVSELIHLQAAKRPKSIDDFANPTDIMIDRLSKATKDDINLLKVIYGKPSIVYAIIKDPSIIQQYLLKYYFSDIHIPGNKTVNYESMTIELIYPSGKEKTPIEREGYRYWCFLGEGPLDANDLSYHIFDEHGRGEHKEFERGYGSVAIANIRRLLNIDEHIQSYIQKRKAQ